TITLLVMPPTLAETVTEAPATVLARFTVATPPEVVVAPLRVPEPEVMAKLTTVLSGTGPPATRVTLAESSTGGPTVTPWAAPALKVRVPGALGLLKAMAATRSLAVPQVTVTVAVPTVALVRVTVAIPPTVVALAAERVPKLVEKFTLVPSTTGVPAAVSTWAWMV